MELVMIFSIYCEFKLFFCDQKDTFVLKELNPCLYEHCNSVVRSVNPINKLFHTCIGSSFPEDWKSVNQRFFALFVWLIWSIIIYLFTELTNIRMAVFLGFINLYQRTTLKFGTSLLFFITHNSSSYEHERSNG